jgi:T-complex protein 1 subunit zeta
MAQSGIKTVNPNADVIGSKHALTMNVNAAKGLQSVLKSNLGPRGTLKMLVSGAGDVKLTKDGKVLLDEMQIQHPTAAIIARTATAQDDITGDGTTSNVLFTGELLHQANRFLEEGLHPRVIVDGFEQAREETLKFLDTFKEDVKTLDRDTMVQVARTSLRTKLHTELADHMTEIIVDAVRCIKKDDQPLDLHMVEIMHMRHKTAFDTRFVDGLVLDHGARHPNMSKYSEKCLILSMNVSLEYERSENTAGLYWKNAEERAKMVAAERKFTDDKVRQVIAFKNEVCSGEKKDYGFIVINQKGIDPVSLDMLAKSGIVGIRRAKLRNMERLSKSVGGYSVNSLEDITPDCLGYCKSVTENTLGEEKFTFVEGCKNAVSCTILITGPNDHTIRQIKDAIKDGLRAVYNLCVDNALVPGAGAFELAAHCHLLKFKKSVQGRAKLGVQAFAEALLAIPKTLADNSGHDPTSALIALMEESGSGAKVGLDVDTGKPFLPGKGGVWDNYRVKKQFLHLGSLIAIKLLLVDEVMRAGRQMGKG